MMKLLKKIRQYMPISRKQYDKDMHEILTVLQGFATSETQHSQLEMSMIQNMNELKSGAATTKDKKPLKDDPAFY